MAWFVLVTDRCRETATAHGLADHVEAFRDRVERSQSTSWFDPFPPPYLVRKQLGRRQGRLIAEVRHVDDHTIVVFLEVLIRGSQAYESGFARDPVGYGRQHYAGLLSQDELAQAIRQRTQRTPEPAKPSPSAAEFSFLYEAFSHHRGGGMDDVVCETAEWVAQVGQERIARQLAPLCRACLELVSREPGLHFSPVLDKPGWGVWALRTEGRLLLIAPATETTAAEAEATARRFAADLEGSDDLAVLRASRRAYPAIILADDDLWIGLEEESVANMALSPEESEVLESARTSAHPFPLFINGRAGSGKSTILQYLFADLLFCYSRRSEARDTAPPIYLTVNPELLRTARNSVERLLLGDATLASKRGRILPPIDYRALLGEALQGFHPYLLSLLSRDDRLGRFPAAARVDYPRFRRLWLERFGRQRKAVREFGPALSWHVIRTFIKGMSAGALFDPDDYLEVPENQRSVSDDTFRSVHSRVWEGWYRPTLEAEGLWDDQDLTRFILDRDLARPVHPAVFCDEAQDFTRLDLELLLRLNLFSDRTLPSADVARVPFAFAGDHFQTLNPTGFRWDAIKAWFVEKFIFELDPARRRGKVDLNYRELKFNYRSTPRITRFGNHVQALRAALFQIPDVRPQTPWASEPHAFPVVYFRADEGCFWKRFRDDPAIVLLVPCGEGEELAFVQDDAILREHVRIEDNVPVNVLSASRAKGCEYSSVVVYGFGAASSVDVIDKLTDGGPDDADANPDQSLPLQYFVNGLYVAVSRAKRRLVIVDSDEGFARLWRCAQDEAAEAAMLDRIRRGREIWATEIEGMLVGNCDELTQETAADPLETARAFETDGVARLDPFLLRQAAQAYRNGGDHVKARECRARAFEAEGAFLDAGEAYFDAGFALPDGVRCLWRAGRAGWSQLSERLATHPPIQHELEFQWARAIIGRLGADVVANLFGRFADRLGDAAFAERCAGDAVWTTATDVVLGPLLESPEQTPAPIWTRMAKGLERIQRAGTALPPAPAARVFFLARRYREAIDLWERSPDTRSADYHRAKAAVEPYPERILSLNNLGLLDEIAEAYSRSPRVALSPEQAGAVVDALAKTGRIDEALALARETAGSAAAFRLAAGVFRSHGSGRATPILVGALVLWVGEGAWDRLSAFATSGELLPAEDWRQPDLRGWVASQVDTLRGVLVRALARSEGLPNAPGSYQRRLTEFLRNYLTMKGGRLPAGLTPAEGGAALERAGRFTDAIAFYEQVYKGRFAEPARQFARERWLVSKTRQLDHERGSGLTRKTMAIEEDIATALRDWRIPSVDALDRYPALPPLDAGAPRVDTVPPADVPPRREAAPEPEPAAADRLVLRLGQFTCDVSRQHARCNLTEDTTMITAFVRCDERRCGGEAGFAQGDDDTWRCALWSLSVRFAGSPVEEVELEFDQLRTSLRLRMGP